MKTNILYFILMVLLFSCSSEDMPDDGPTFDNCDNGLNVNIILTGELNTTITSTESFFDTKCDGNATDCLVRLYFRKDNVLLSVFFLDVDLNQLEGSYSNFNEYSFVKGVWITIESFDNQTNMVSGDFSYTSTPNTTGVVTISEYNGCQLSGKIDLKNINDDLTDPSTTRVDISGSFTISGD